MRSGSAGLPLFAGSDRSGSPGAAIASLVQTCKLDGIDPQISLADVITRIVGGSPPGRLDDLMPWDHPTIPGLEGAA